MSHDRAAPLVDLFHRLYPAPDDCFAAPLEPDLLGEELVRQVLGRDLSLLDRLLEAVSERQAQQALVLVGRLLEDERTALDLARRVMDRVDAVPHLPVPLREAAVAATRRVLASHVADRPEPDEAHAAEHARLLNNLGVRLAELGRREDARDASLEAIRTLGPYFLRMPRAFQSWMATMIQVYRKRCEEAGLIPDEELLGPLEVVLAELDG